MNENAIKRDKLIEDLTETMYASTQYWTVRPPRSSIAQLAIVALMELGHLDFLNRPEL